MLIYLAILALLVCFSLILSQSKTHQKANKILGGGQHKIPDEMIDEYIEKAKLAHLGDQHNLGWLYNTLDLDETEDDWSKNPYVR